MSAPLTSAPIAAIADGLLGQPTTTERGGMVRRYGRRGSLKVDCQHGVWRDFEAGLGGGMVDLVARELRLDRRAAWEWLAQGGAAPGRRDDAARAAALAEAAREDAKRIAEAATIWRAAVPIDGTMAAAYLARRGLGNVHHGGQLRFAPDLVCGRWRGPVMVARVINPGTGRGQAVHLTPIGPHGRARGDDGEPIAKRVRGKAAGGVIALAAPDADGRLGVAEGIETALGAARAADWPTISALSAGGMANLPALPGVTVLGIMADDDNAGRAAAETLAARWAAMGLQTTLHLPPGGGDWNDQLLRRTKP